MKTNRSTNKLKSNIISSSAYQVLAMIVPIVTTPYVTRIFDVTQMGEYSLSLTLASFFVVVAQFGIPTFGAREIAFIDSNEKNNNIFFKLESIQIFISLLSFILYNLIFIAFMDSENKTLFFVQSLLILVNIFDISWYFVGIEEIGKVIIRNALTKLFTTITIFVIIDSNNQLVLYALINVIGTLLGNLTMVFQSFKYIDYSYFKFSINKKYLSSSFKLLIPVLANSSYDSAEKSILGFATNPSEVGIYNEAKKIINLIVSVINSAFNALSPRMSFYVSKGEKEHLQLYFLKGLDFSSLFSIIAVSGIVVVADDFVEFFYGPGYEMVSQVLKVSGLSLIVMPVIVLIRRGLLIPYRKDKEFTNAVIIVLISGIVLNLTLNSIYGAVGAAISFSLTQLFSYIYVIYVVRKLVSLKILLFHFIKVITMIIVNVVLVHTFSNIVTIENSILLFIVKGFISVTMNILILAILSQIKKLNRS